MTRGLARVTLVDFFIVMLVALVLLAPIGAGGAAAWVIGVGVVSLALVARPGLEAVSGRRARTIGLRVQWRMMRQEVSPWPSQSAH